MPYKRRIVSVIKDRINEQRRFIQIVIGPRQTGKATAVTRLPSRSALRTLAGEIVRCERTRGERVERSLRARLGG